MENDKVFNIHVRMRRRTILYVPSCCSGAAFGNLGWGGVGWGGVKWSGVRTRRPRRHERFCEQLAEFAKQLNTACHGHDFLVLALIAFGHDPKLTWPKPHCHCHDSSKRINIAVSLSNSQRLKHSLYANCFFSPHAKPRRLRIFRTIALFFCVLSNAASRSRSNRSWWTRYVHEW